VNYYNEQKGTDVTVLGWDIESQDGLFTGNFDSLDDGRAFAENLMAEGADIILPVAGPVGLGAAAAVQDNGSARLIGVDADWTQTAPEFGDIILTSILKRIDVAVTDAARAVVNDAAGSLLVSTLESGGVGVAPVTNPFKENAELAAELETLSAGIIAGDIVTTSQG
jgi:basic membrane protein A and related proteins